MTIDPTSLSLLLICVKIFFAFDPKYSSTDPDFLTFVDADIYRDLNAEKSIEEGTDGEFDIDDNLDKQDRAKL
ncbi:hypothetical protein F8M41_006304 [Gigaspora margarita]|uniref:Uncharacterized protein n=1 Tax=Gigaspora margarita TaxID=4874 RepID=A0A8H4A5D7_GIGMA|nr:hypothetical protein F8M41_006304 [Gigaspora margarita]